MHIRDIVTTAGGIEAVARACHIQPAAVLAWSQRNHIPARNRHAIALLAGVKSVTVDKWLAQCTPAPKRAYGRSGK